MAGRNITVTQLYDKIAIAALTEEERKSRYSSVGATVYEYMTVIPDGGEAFSGGSGVTFLPATKIKLQSDKETCCRFLVAVSEEGSSAPVFKTGDYVFWANETGAVFSNDFSNGLGVCNKDNIGKWASSNQPGADGVCFLVYYGNKICWAYLYTDNGQNKLRIKSGSSTPTTVDAANLITTDSSATENSVYYFTPFDDVSLCICAKFTSLGSIPAPQDNSGGGYYLAVDVFGDCHSVGVDVYLASEPRRKYLSYEIINDPASDTTTHELITLEPFLKKDTTNYTIQTVQEIYTRYVSKSGGLNSQTYPFLAGTIETTEGGDTVVNRLFFADDGESFPAINQDESYVVFTLGAGTRNQKTYYRALVPSRLDGPECLDCMVYGGRVSGNNEWFCAGSNASTYKPFTAQNLSGDLTGDTPNNNLRYTSWERSTGMSMVPVFDDISGITWSEGETDANGITTITLTDDATEVTKTAFVYDLRVLANNLNATNAIVYDHGFWGSNASYPYYMVFFVDAAQKKEALTTGILTTPYTGTFTLSWHEPDYYQATTAYHYGDICLYKEEDETTYTVYMFTSRVNENKAANDTIKGIPPTNAAYWTDDVDVDREEAITVSIKNLAGTTTTPEEGDPPHPYERHLVNTRAMCPVVKTGLGVSRPLASQIELPDSRGKATVALTKVNSELSTNYYSDDDKNGSTQVHLVYNLYRGRLRPGNTFTLHDEFTSVYSEDEESPWLQGPYKVKSNIFLYKEDAVIADSETVTVTENLLDADSNPIIEPLTGYTYVLTYGFGSVSGGTRYGAEYVCDWFTVTSGIGLFRYGVETPFLGFGEQQKQDATIEYLENVTETRSVTIPPDNGSGGLDRYVYIVLGEYRTGTGTYLEGEGFGAATPISKTISDPDIIHDINATVLAKARIPAEYIRFAPSFSGQAFLSFVEPETVTTPDDDFYLANRPEIMALIQNENTFFDLPTITWLPDYDSSGYGLVLFVVSTTQNIGEKFPYLLHRDAQHTSAPFSFTKYQVLAEARIPYKLKDLACELDVTFNLSFS